MSCNEMLMILKLYWTWCHCKLQDNGIAVMTHGYTCKDGNLMFNSFNALKWVFVLNHLFKCWVACLSTLSTQVWVTDSDPQLWYQYQPMPWGLACDTGKEEMVSWHPKPFLTSFHSIFNETGENLTFCPETIWVVAMSPQERKERRQRPCCLLVLRRSWPIASLGSSDQDCLWHSWALNLIPSCGVHLCPGGVGGWVGCGGVMLEEFLKAKQTGHSLVVNFTLLAAEV